MFECHKCGKAFSKKGYLKNHLNQANPCDKPIKCKKCGDEFKSTQALRRHLDRKTNCENDIVEDIPPLNKDNSCHVCGKKYATKSNLKRHLKSCKVRKKDVIRILLRQQNQIDQLKSQPHITNNITIINAETDGEFSESYSEELSDESFPPFTEYIYLIREREFIRLEEPTYKIGRTTQDPNSRLSGYPKGSEVVLFIGVINCIKAEKKLLNIFDKKFEQKEEYGREYFYGDVQKMRKTILECIIDQIEESEESTEISEDSESI